MRDQTRAWGSERVEARQEMLKGENKQAVGGYESSWRVNNSATQARLVEVPPSGCLVVAPGTLWQATPLGRQPKKNKMYRAGEVARPLMRWVGGCMPQTWTCSDKA